MEVNMSLTEKNQKLIKQFDEAIANETEMAEGLREQYECMMECSDIFREQKKVFIEQCKHDAEYHEQITEWLEELKAIKSDGFTDDLLNMGFTKGYNKAIDDCKELTFREVVYCDSLNDRTEFRELAEQLKAKKQ